MADPSYFNNLRRMYIRQEEMYAETYQAYLNNENKRVRSLVADVTEEYPLSPLMPKFVFLDALSYVTEGNTEKFRERLQELLEKWPDTDMTEMASGMLKNLKQGMTIKGGQGNSRGMLWDTRLTADGGDTPTDANGQPANFEHDPNSPQYLVLAFPRDSINANQLLYDVARFNFSTFTTQDFDLEQMAFGNVGLLIVKGFANVRQLEHYRTVLAQAPQTVLPEAVRPIMISRPNFELLLREGRSFDEYFRYEEKAAVEQTEEAVVGTTDDATEPDAATEPTPEAAAEQAAEPAETPAEEPSPEPAEGTPSEEAPQETPAETPQQEAAQEPTQPEEEAAPAEQ